jgi:hypothetical protein
LISEGDLEHGFTYAIGFGGLTATKRPAILPSGLALLGFATAAAYLV